MGAQALNDPFRPPAAQGLRAGAALSLAVHGALLTVFAALVWRSAPPQAVMAELWSAVPKQAAPTPAPEPEPTPAEPERAPAPAPAPPPAPSPTAARDADIALQKKRQQEALEQQRLAEQRQREKLEREKAEREKAQKAKAERERAEREKAERQKTEKLKADREKAEREKAEREKVERDKAEKERRERVARERAEKQAEQRAEKLRQENLARMQGLAGATGSSDATGSAAQSSGPSAGYAGRIRARIKPLIVYPDPGTGNPVAEVEVRLSPTGVILGSRLVRRSGTPEWDAAVLRAVEKAEVLPRDVDGRVPPVMVLVFSPRE